MHAPCATNATGNTPVASLVTRTGALSPVHRAAGPWLDGIYTRHASLDTHSWVRESRTIRQRQCRRFRPCTFAAAHMSRGKAAFAVFTGRAQLRRVALQSTLCFPMAIPGNRG